MTIKEIHTKAGSLTGYGWYIFILSCWNFAYNRFEALGPELLGDPVASLLDWGLVILAAPLLTAGLIGGIYEQQRTGEDWSLEGFLGSALRHYWRVMAANLLAMAVVLAGYLAVSLALLLAGGQESDPTENLLLLALIRVPLAAVLLFWFTGIAVERRIFRGLQRALWTLLSHPFALALGMVWGLIGFADMAGLDYLDQPPTAVLDGIRAGVLAVVRVMTVVYALSIYRQRWGEAVHVPQEAGDSTADGWIRAGFGFGLFSFLPLVHLAALVLGIGALRRARRFSLRAAVACCAGGFFTLYYLLLAAGWLAAGRAGPAVTYEFLSRENPALVTYVKLLDQGLYEDVQSRLAQPPLDSPDRHWTFDFLSAQARLQAYDLPGALDDFRAAARKGPARGEFYYYYGLALLENDQQALAAEQFRLALEREPGLDQAKRQLDLIASTYEPSRELSVLLFIVILLILFTVHEYGHAYAAWKLGDDTARQQGRLTLNPLPHLDLFGSILLPALLIWQQTAVVFGWARPVPVNPDNFKDPPRDHVRVSFAGPAMNFLISMACLLVLGGLMLALRLAWPETLSLNLSTPYSSVSLTGPPFARWLILLIVFLKQLFYTSLVLGVFNLIPIPPLDGSWILSGLLPAGGRRFFEAIRPYAYLLFLVMVFTATVDYVLMVPIYAAWWALDLVFVSLGLG